MHGRQIDAMPITVNDKTLLVSASALTLRTDWIRPFTPGGMEAETGPGAARTWPACTEPPVS